MSNHSYSFAGNVLKLVTGNVFAQALGVLAAPFIARLFTPEAFGIAALFLSITSIINVVVCLRYEVSIMLPKTDEEAANLLGVSLAFVLITTGISILGIFFAWDIIADLLMSQNLRKYLWLIPVSVFVNGTFVALNYWNSRTKHFGRLSIARIISSVATQTTKLGTGIAGFVGAGVLIGADILGQIVSTLILGWKIWRDDGQLFKDSIHRKKMVANLKLYKKFPLYGIFPSLLDNLTLAMPVLFFTKFFGSTVTGYYSFGMRIIQLPVTLVGVSISQVFHQKIASTQAVTGEISFYVEQVFQRLVFMTIPILLVMLSAPLWFKILFGPQWNVAGQYVMILAPGVALRFTVSPISVVFGVRNRQELAAIWKVISLISTAILLGVSLPFADAKYSLYFLVINDLFIYSLYLYLIFRVSRASIKRAIFSVALR